MYGRLRSVLSHSCIRVVYDHSTLMGLQNFSNILSGDILALEPKLIYKVGILHWQDPETSKAAHSPSTSGREGTREVCKNSVRDPASGAVVQGSLPG